MYKSQFKGLNKGGVNVSRDISYRDDHDADCRRKSRTTRGWINPLNNTLYALRDIWLNNMHTHSLQTPSDVGSFKGSTIGSEFVMDPRFGFHWEYVVRRSLPPSPPPIFGRTETNSDFSMSHEREILNEEIDPNQILF